MSDIATPGSQAGPLQANERLLAAGLRPTRQRVALARLLFASGDRHVTAESLFEEAARARIPVSLATVYNTLHQFTNAGLLREIAVDGARVYFDTNVDEHHHFLLEDSGALSDIPSASVTVDGLPEPPPGMKILRVDVIVRLGVVAEPETGEPSDGPARSKDQSSFSPG